MEASNPNIRHRLLWIDWMKAIAMLFIIWGHFFSRGYAFIYVFNVPAFCLISGFLYKKEERWNSFITKSFYNLFVPMVLMSLIMYLEKWGRALYTENPFDLQILTFCKYFIIGNQWALGPCWYIYALIIMKLIMQLLPSKYWANSLLFAITSITVIILHRNGYEKGNAYTDAMITFPFFIIGTILQHWKNQLDKLHHILAESVILLLSTVLVYICCKFNGEVWMYQMGYGSNFLLFLLGGLSGSAMIYIISLWGSRLPYRRMVITLSKGSILILGIHIIIVRRLTELPARCTLEDFIFSIAILMLFVPLIRLTELFCPILLGKYRNHFVPNSKTNHI